jgi:hypothetical protein
MSIPNYASIPLVSTWPEQVLVNCYKHNECMAVFSQWEVNRPDIFYYTILPIYANDGHVNDRTPAQRQQRYEATLSSDGLKHERDLLNPTETPWGIVREIDGLSLDVRTRKRERMERVHEWGMDADLFSVLFVRDLIETTNRIITIDHPDEYLALKNQSDIRNQKIIALNLKYHAQAVEETGARMGVLLLDAYNQGGTLDEIWARVV